MAESMERKTSGTDIRTEVLREAVKAAANQTLPCMTPEGKVFSPTEAALAVIEAYKAAVKALGTELPCSPTTLQAEATGKLITEAA